MAKIILLGGTGFIGTPLSLSLQKEGFQIKVLKHNSRLQEDVDYFEGDILTPGMMDEYLENNDIIINLVGQMNNDISIFTDNNILGGLNVLDSSIKKKNIRLILISSINVYGDNLVKPSKEEDVPKPQTIYGIVKLSSEILHQYYSKLYGLDVTVLRMASVYGPGKKAGIFVNLINSIKTTDNTTVYNNGMQQRDMLFIEDAVKGIIQTIKNPNKGYKVYNISNSQKYTIKEIILMIERICSKKLNVKYIDDIPDECCLWADNSLAKTKLQFNPTTKIEDGLKLTIKSYSNS